MIFDLECNGMQLARLYGFDYPGRVVDTLILSRLIFNRLSEEADEYGKHALSALGQTVGLPQGRLGGLRAVGSADGGLLRRTARLPLATLWVTVAQIGDRTHLTKKSINPSQSKGLR